MMAAAAPARCALRTFTMNSQPPRSAITMIARPLGHVAVAKGLQPLRLAGEP
jgi:hypothetical protein